MATVDFTLDDVRRAVRDDVRGIIHEEVPVIVAQEFLNFWEANLHPALETMNGRIDGLEQEVRELKHEVKGTARVVRQHSLDIMNLRAAR